MRLRIAASLLAVALGMAPQARAVTAAVTLGTGVTSGVIPLPPSGKAAWRIIVIDNESTTATIACSFGGTPAINTAGSFTITAGNTRVWARSGITWSDQINCLASASSTPVTVQYQ